MLHIKLTQNFEDFDNFCKEIITCNPNIIGLDTETLKHTNSDIFGIDIIQFCIEITHLDFIQEEYYQSIKIDGNRKYVSYVFKMSEHYKYALPSKMRTILENKNMIKVGCDIMTDVYRMKQIYDFVDRGYVDNQYIATSLGNKDFSLNALSLKYMGIKKYNSNDIILYAAWDAYLSLCTYLCLIGKYNKMIETNIKTINVNKQEIDNLLYHLINKTTLFTNNTTTKKKLINTINTCYAVWTKKYNKEEVNTLINYTIKYWSDKNIITINDDNVFLNINDNNTKNSSSNNSMMDKLFKVIPEKGMKKQSMINFISNSFYFNETKENKFKKSSEFIQNLIETGKLKKTNSLKYICS